MSLEHVNIVLDHSTQRGPRLVTLLAVAFNCDQHGEWTTDQATLRKEARVGSRSRIKQILKDLVACGELAVVSHHGRGRLSNYRLLIGTAKAKPSGRSLSGSQAAVARVNRLLREAGVPLPKPAQIGLWSKTLGGIEPLVDKLTLLIQSGLASKLDPVAYLHRVFTTPTTSSATTEQTGALDG